MNRFIYDSARQMLRFSYRKVTGILLIKVSRLAEERRLSQLGQLRQLGPLGKRPNWLNGHNAAGSSNYRHLSFSFLRIASIAGVSEGNEVDVDATGNFVP